MDFVWPYVKRFSFWDKSGMFNELDYSIRSVRENYQGDVRCFVIGDDPELDVIHLPAPPLVESDPVTKQPRHKDQMNKFKVLLDSEVNEEFVLMYDDIYILKPTTKADLMKTYGRCELHNPVEYIKTRMGGAPYKRLWLSTYEYIVTFRHSKGQKTYDWETHLPRFMEKSKLKWIIEALNLTNIPRISTSLYPAHYAEETFIMPEGLQSDIWTHTPGMDFDKEFECHYMNIGDDVIVPELIERMVKLFGA